MSTLRFGRMRSGFWLALAAACLLVVQAAGSAYALGASQQRLDAFGNPLCISDSVSPDHGSSDHDKASSCCMLGCSLSAAAFAAPEEVVAILDCVGEARLAPQPPALAGPVAAEHNPGSPRAPPPAA